MEPRTLRFVNSASLATATLTLKRLTQLDAEYRWAVVAYLPADYPEVIGVARETDAASVADYWRIGVNWLNRLGFETAKGTPNA